MKQYDREQSQNLARVYPYHKVTQLPIMDKTIIMRATVFFKMKETNQLGKIHFLIIAEDKKADSPPRKYSDNVDI